MKTSKPLLAAAETILILPALLAGFREVGLYPKPMRFWIFLW